VRIRDATRALLLVATAAVPATAAALGVTADAGLQYTRFDGWSAGGDRVTMPSLDLDLRLDARGAIVSRDVFDYGLSVAWGRMSGDSAGGITSTRDMLSYSARGALFANAVSPVNLAAFGTRGETDFSTSEGPDSFGHGVATSTGGTLAVKGAGIPTLTTDYSFTTSENEIAGQPLREQSFHSLTSALSFGTPAFQMNASYAGEFREGSWDTDRNTTHGILVGARGMLGGGHTLSLQSSSTFSIPDELVPGTYEQRTTSFSAYVNAGGLGDRRNFSYGYGHSTTESPGAPTIEGTHQALRYEGDHFVTSSTFFTRWLVDASLGETRSGDDDPIRSTGETLGVSLWWRRLQDESTLEVNAGPRVSLYQTEDDRGGGFGASAGARFSRPLFDDHAFQLSWSGSYGQNLFANVGWQFSQELDATLSGPAATARYNASLHGSAFRTHSPTTGDGAARSIGATAGLATRRVSLDARAALSQGMLGATQQAFTSDGLLLPAPFDSTLVDVSIGGVFRIYPGLGSGLRFRLGRSDVPGRPVLHETGASASLSYRFGALSLTLEDRYTRTETATGWDSANLVMLSLHRSLAW
jgi:hypothetical protein